MTQIYKKKTLLSLQQIHNVFFYNTLQHFTQLHTTLHNYAQTLHNFTQLYNKYKAFHKALQNFTQAYKTLQTLQNFTTLYTPLNNFTKVFFEKKTI